MAGDEHIAQNLGIGENLEVRAWRVIGMTAGLLAMLVIVAFGFALLFSNRIGVRFVPRHVFPAPGVISTEHSQRLAIEGRQRGALEGGGSRMPIAQAMRQIAARGDRAFDPVTP